MEIDLSELSPIFEKYRGKRGFLIPLLQDVQGHYGYVPEDVVGLICNEFAVPSVDIYGALTFYAQFYLTPRGKHTIRACQGTACYIMGGSEILEHLKDSLGVSVEETTQDGLFTLETVACLGCCGMAPVMAIDDSIYGKSSVGKGDELIEELRRNESVEKA
jgi:NADH-quinone oxidoreductase subunit E